MNLFLADDLLIISGECPATHPNVYYNGQYCCKSGKMKVYAPQGDQCDGSDIKKTSLCCEGDQYVPCPSGNCDSFGNYAYLIYKSLIFGYNVK